MKTENNTPIPPYGVGREWGLGFIQTKHLVILTVLVLFGALVSMQVWNMERYARDTDRISALNRMETGLAVYWADAGRYPMPEGDISTGSIEGSVRAYLGTFGEAVAQNLKMGGVPTDPLSGFRYVYAVDARQREYQIMAMLESSITYTFLLTGIASVSPEIRIIGNYSWSMSSGSGSEVRIVRIPSLIWSNTGSVDLLSDRTHYVTARKSDVP